MHLLSIQLTYEIIFLNFNGGRDGSRRGIAEHGVGEHFADDCELYAESAKNNGSYIGYVHEAC